ncbi:hypothetical protein JXQ70_11670 [bacterium]|nr:hypothetical protein [bacterium]
MKLTIEKWGRLLLMIAFTGVIAVVFHAQRLYSKHVLKVTSVSYRGYKEEQS